MNTIKRIRHIGLIENQRFYISNLRFAISLIKKGQKARLLTILVIIAIVSPLAINTLLNFQKNRVLADSFFKLDEGYGTTSSVNDGNGAVSAGSITGAVWRTEDLCFDGKCLYFDGDGDFVSFADDADLDFAGADSFTINLWFRHAPISSGTQVLIAKLLGSDNDGGYSIQMESDGDITCEIEDDDADATIDDDVTSTGATYDDNRWHHVSCVKSGTSSLTLYIDGLQVDTDSALDGSSTLANDDAFYIGIDGDGISNDFQGFIDEVKVYRSAKTEAEIKGDYVKGSTLGETKASFIKDYSPLSDGLVGYWKLDETSGNAADRSGNGYTLTNNGTTTFVAGKFGNGSEHVPASSQHFSTASTISDIKSFSFWTNPDSTTNYYISLTSGAYLTSSSGTLSTTGLSNAQIFVNGVKTTTIAADTWQHITVIFDTSVNADLFYIGRQGTNYYDGTLDEVRLYNRTLTPSEMGGIFQWAPGPVGWWKFDDNTGTSAADSSSNSNNGTLTGMSYPWTTGKFSSAIRIDGSTGYINMGSPSLLDNLDLVTYEAWIYPTGYGEGNFGRIINKSPNNSTLTGLTLVNDSGQQAVRLFKERDDISSTSITSANGSIPLNTWHHIAATYSEADPTQRMYLYINGQIQSNATYVAGTGNRNSDEIYNLLIGNREDNDRTFQGSIDDVRIYNYLRTPDQIIEDMNAGHPAPGSPVGSATSYWKLDEGYDTTAYDGSINANNLTLSATGWTGSGKFGKAYDGATNRRMTRSDDGDFDFTSGTDSFTISLWFNRGGAISNAEYLFDKHATNDGYTIYMDSDGDIVCGIGDGTSFPEDTAGTNGANYDDTNWHHAVCVKNGTSSLRLYIDGNEVADDTAISADADMSNAGSLIVGDTNETDGTDEWLGDIDEIKFYRLAMTADQIKTEYNHGFASSMGSLSTTSTGTSSNSSTDSYCPPGQGSACTPPLIHFKLDENTGQTIYDASGNGNRGCRGSETLCWTTPTIETDDPPWIPGKFGSALSFDGVNDTVSEISDSTPLDIETRDLTIEAWIYRRSNTSDDIVIGKMAGTYCSVGVSGYFLMIWESDELGLNLCDGTNSWEVYSPQNAVSVGSWHHVALTADRNTPTNSAIYINGVSQTRTLTGTMPTNSIGNIYSIQFGRTGASGAPFDGYIDELKIYDYARTPTQVAWDYNRGKPGAWYKFDETSGTDAYNSAKDGNGNAAGINGAITSTSYSVSGKVNSALDFNGTTSYVSVTNADTIDQDIGLSRGLTISTWIKPDTDGEGDVGRIFTKNTNTWCRIDTESAGKADLECSLDLATDATKNVSQALTIGSWNHVALSWSNDSDDEITLWVNGKAAGTSVDGNGDASADTADLIIGNDSTSATATFDGLMDEFKIFNYELTLQQIQTLHNEGSAVRF